MTLPRTLSTVILWVCSGLWAYPGQAVTLVERSDVTQGLKSLICKNSNLPNAIPLEMWALDIRDAQIEGGINQPHTNQMLTDVDLARQARSLAQIHHYNGYTYGRCADGRIWTVALPSPHPLTKNDSELVLPLSTLQQHCASWRADFAKNSGGDAELMHVRGGKISTQQLGDGVISVSCQPHSPSWLGPVEWFLAPVGNAPKPSIPGEHLLTQNDNPTDALLSWINHMRINQKLQPVLLNRDLVDVAENLIIDTSLAHNRTFLRKISSQLSDQKIRFLGENRVKGRSRHELAWLLWYSPRHRSLLLSSDANNIGVAIKRVGGNDLAVLIFADRPEQRLGRNIRLDPSVKVR